MLAGIIICLSVGLLMVALGLILWLGKRIGMVHDYHHQNVKKKDVAAYCREMGIGLILIGAGIVITGVVWAVTRSLWAWIAAAFGFLAGFLLSNHAQKTYNGSWFG